MEKVQLHQFRETVCEYYKNHGRHSMLWRQPDLGGLFDPYKIMISEVMLQQTQVARVHIKYQEFLQAFPSLQALAQSELGEVLIAWQGLGYNRRAKYLRETAQKIVKEYDGVFPQTITELVKLPGIGPNTAAAIIAYTWNRPVVFIETNIRTVFIHHFFTNSVDVDDLELKALVQQTLPVDQNEIREWYWALMDYGSYLKQTVGNLNKLSKTYVKQSKFIGSSRQIRGKILKLLSSAPCTLSKLTNEITDDRLENVLNELVREGLIQHKNDMYSV